MTKEKLIITVHLNGPLRDSNPNLPYSPKEISDQAVACWHEGAAVVHYHICDPETGMPSTDAALFAETERLIKQQCDIITFPTLGGLRSHPDGRVAHILELAKDPATKPDCVPVDMLTTNLDIYDSVNKRFTSLERIYSNTTGTWMDIAEKVSAVGVMPVPMFWNVASVRVVEKMIEMKVFKEPLFCEVSVYGEPYLGFGHPATVKGLNAIIDFFPPDADWRWTASVIGANAFSVLANAIERGGDVAIGLHDYHYPELGLPTNAELITRVADMSRAMGRDIASTVEARALLGLNK